MKDHIISYLDDIEVGKTVRENVTKVFAVAEMLSPEEIEDIFITNIISDNGMNEYLNVWLFTENYILEAKNFLLSTDVDLLCLTGNIGYIKIRSENFDFASSDEASRLFFNFTIKNTFGLGGEFVASGPNCSYLLAAVKKYFLESIKSIDGELTAHAHLE